MKILLVLAAIAGRVVLAQSSPVLDELQGRANAALNSIPHASTASEVESRRDQLRQRLFASLGLNRAIQGSCGTALLYSPVRIHGQAPAILVVRPHGDPGGGETQVLIATLVDLGFHVLAFDFRAEHDRLDLLQAGIAPAGLVQRAILLGFEYLVSRPDVDRRHIGVLGDGLAATLAAAINPELSALVLIDAGPGFNERIRRMRDDRSGKPDLCELVPGIVKYCDLQELLALVAPRPVLAINPGPDLSDYVTDLFGSFNADGKLIHLDGDAWGTESRHATYRWLARWLQGRANLGSMSESGSAPHPKVVPLPCPIAAAKSGKRPPEPLTASALASYLGEDLPLAHMGYALQVAQQQRIKIDTQPGFEVPVTVFRPGPEGADPETGDLIAIADAGRASLTDDEIVREAVRRGWMVWAVDPRGIGELKTDNEGFVFGVSLLLGENFVWRQAADIVRIVGLLGRSAPSHRTMLYARGKNMSLGAAYAAVAYQGNQLECVVLRDATSSLPKTADYPPYIVPFGVRDEFEFSDLIHSAKAKVVVITDVDEFLGSW